MYDLLLTNAHVLTMDTAFTQHPRGFVATQGADLAALGPMGACPPPQQAKQIIDCAGCVVMPGLINCHTHLPMAYFRGLADDLPLQTWLKKHIWPAEAKYLNSDFVYEVTQYAAAESIKGGVTCVNDMYPFAADVARACADAGLRGFIGEGVLDGPTPSAHTWQEGARMTTELISQYQHHPLITPTVCPHAPYTCSVDLLQALHVIATERGLLYHIHLHETFEELDRIAWANNDESPTHALKRIGVLGPKMVAVHCVWVDDHDLHHMQELGCGVAHCPTSNLKLGSGIAPVHSMIEAEVPVGVGTDGAASNNNLNLWEEIHLSALLAKGVYKSPDVVPARMALSFATSRAASMLQSDDIGVLAPGKRADVIVVEVDGLHATPTYPHDDGIYSTLTYCAQAADVRDTIIHGKLQMRNRELLGLDEEQLKAKARAWVTKNFV
jgi:5-methylthioadenosine/S-adenosylhomocysteine deaminase